MAVQELRDVLPGDRVITEPSVIEGYRRDEAQWAAAGKPLAVVRPRHTDEVISVVRFCLERGIPIVPRGAGSGVPGALCHHDDFLPGFSGPVDVGKVVRHLGNAAPGVRVLEMGYATAYPVPGAS
jgi:FAD/FMN-containing dehydrogenase